MGDEAINVCNLREREESLQLFIFMGKVESHCLHVSFLNFSLVFLARFLLFVLFFGLVLNFIIFQTVNKIICTHVHIL